jgi:hypothetical protein
VRARALAPSYQRESHPHALARPLVLHSKQSFFFDRLFAGFSVQICVKGAGLRSRSFRGLKAAA